MTQIEDLQQRITRALDRVASGVAALDAARAQQPVADAAPAVAPAAVDDSELTALREALDEEKLANAQLEERLHRLRDTHETELAEALAAATPAPAAPKVDALNDELYRLRKANEMLSATNEEMRSALAESVGEPHLINKAMLAELESLRAARAVDMAETQAVLAALNPLLEAAAQDAPTGGPV